MEKLSYKQAFDLITEAYIRGEIKPMDKNFCFCGTLAGGANWCRYSDIPESQYSAIEYAKMESALFFDFSKEGCRIIGNRDCPRKKYEDKLFEGMCAALEVLKQIHKERGENVEEFEFVKRDLVL